MRKCINLPKAAQMEGHGDQNGQQEKEMEWSM